MSNKLQVILYVSSIVVAIGIGFFRVGAEENIGGTSECKQGTETGSCSGGSSSCGNWSKCKTIALGTGADSCTETSGGSCYDSNKKECNNMGNAEPSTQLGYVECNAGG